MSVAILNPRMALKPWLTGKVSKEKYVKSAAAWNIIMACS